MSSEDSLANAEKAIVLWAKTTFTNNKIPINSLKDFQNGDIICEILQEIDPIYYNEYSQKYSQENLKILWIYNYLSLYLIDNYEESIDNLAEIDLKSLTNESPDVYKGEIIPLISVILALCLLHPQHNAIYIEKVQSLEETLQNTLIFLSEPIIKKLQAKKEPLFEEIPVIEEQDEGQIKRMLQSLDELESENQRVKQENERILQENASFKEKNAELVEQIKGMLKLQDSRIKEFSRYESLEREIRLKENKIQDLEERSEAEIRRFLREITNLKQELDNEKRQNAALSQKNEKLSESFKAKVEDLSRKYEDLRQIHEERELKLAKMQVLEDDFAETRKNFGDLEAKTMEKDKKLNELSLKLKESELLLGEKDQLIANLERNLQEIVANNQNSEGNMNKSAYFSIQNSGISKVSPHVSTLKSQIVENFAFDGGKKVDQETQCEETRENLEEMLKTPVNLQEKEKNKEISEENQRLLEKNSEISKENQRLRLEINENREYLKKISSEMQKVSAELASKNRNLQEIQEDYQEISEESKELRQSYESCVRKIHDLQNALVALESENRISKKTARQDERDRIEFENTKTIKKFQYKISELSGNLEQKEQEIKLLVTTLCELRMNYQEKLERLQATAVKPNQAFFQSLTLSQINS